MHRLGSGTVVVVVGGGTGAGVCKKIQKRQIKAERKRMGQYMQSQCTHVSWSAQGCATRTHNAPALMALACMNGGQRGRLRWAEPPRVPAKGLAYCLTLWSPRLFLMSNLKTVE